MNIDYLKKILTARVYDVATETPLELAPALSQRLNNQIYFKREDMQSVFSFKIRGAYNKMAQLSDAERKRGVICASAGNHAQGVALSAARMGCRAVIVMPTTTPPVKIDAVKARGGVHVEIVLHGESYTDAYNHALTLEKEQKLTFVHPFDDPDVIAGQGTIGIEIAPHTPDVVIVPIGGGGLASGVALALKSQGVRVVGAQVEGVDSMARAIKGDTAAIDPARTLADGVRVKVPGLLTRRLCACLLDDVVIVREAELRETLVRLALEENLIAEGAGALALAAGRRVAGKRKCAVVSGGNIDAAMLATLLSEVRPRAPRKPRRRTAELVPPDPPKPRPRPLEKRRATATLSAPPVIPAPMAPSAPQPVSEEEFTW